MKRTHHRNRNVAVILVRGTLVRTLGSTPGGTPTRRRPNAPRGRPQPMNLEIPMFLLILYGRKRGAHCGYMAQLEGVWVPGGHVWWGYLFRAQTSNEYPNKFMGYGGRWATRFLETGARRWWSGSIYRGTEVTNFHFVAIFWEPLEALQILTSFANYMINFNKKFNQLWIAQNLGILSIGTDKTTFHFLASVVVGLFGRPLEKVEFKTSTTLDCTKILIYMQAQHQGTPKFFKKIKNQK